MIDNFRERKVGDNWIDNFMEYSARQWADFSYSLPNGECLAAVQSRNISALNEILTRHKDENIVVGTHGTALSAIINYYDSSYGYDDFLSMIDLMPWAVKISYDGNNCFGMEKIDLFNLNQKPDYTQCKVCISNLGALKAYRFVVIFARYRNKWLYCRAKDRDSFETAGGHIENNETTLEAARRELYEETGAVHYDIEPAFDYSVHIPTAYSNGQLFFARIKELGTIPDFEMAEVKLFDAIPDKMRFPGILPVLYHKIQGWLNLQSAKDELWDVYDFNRQLTGRTHRRADPLAAGDYHLSVQVWLQNSKGEYLITQRSPNKGYPYMWECQGGAAIAGDDSISAAIREVKEETGFDVMADNGKRLYSMKRENDFCDVWMFWQDFDIKKVVLLENETVDAKYAGKDEILGMAKEGKFFAYTYLEDMFARTGSTFGLARKTMERLEWMRITKREYSYKEFNNEDFTGAAGLLRLLEVRAPLIVNCHGEMVKVVDTNYTWLQFAFKNRNYWLTVTLDENDKIIQYYYDISFCNFIESGGTSWFFDLYLDVVMLPDGRLLLLDENELNGALEKRTINRRQYDLAVNTAQSLMDELKGKEKELAAFCKKYYSMLQQK